MPHQHGAEMSNDRRTSVDQSCKKLSNKLNQKEAVTGPYLKKLSSCISPAQYFDIPSTRYCHELCYLMLLRGPPIYALLAKHLQAGQQVLMCRS